MRARYCAGPFLDTAAPVVDAESRGGCSYVDVTAEQASARSTFETYDEAARAAGVTVIPAARFYGGGRSKPVACVRHSTTRCSRRT